MSLYAERAVLSLHKMIREMERKNIELARIVKCSTQLIMAGTSPNSIPHTVLVKLLKSQNQDGGFVSNVDTIWNLKFLSYYKETEKQQTAALAWLNNHRTGAGFGRSYRDMGRIPVSGLAFYLLPQLCENNHSLNWLENLWISEKNSLTYKAAYTLLAFKQNNYIPNCTGLIDQSVEWLVNQQEDDGGFSPWKGHPVGTNIYCTGVSCLGLLCYPEIVPKHTIRRAYEYMARTQLINGVWPYHELEDGAAWGLRALVEIEKLRSRL